MDLILLAFRNELRKIKLIICVAYSRLLTINLSIGQSCLQLFGLGFLSGAGMIDDVCVWRV